MSKTETTSNWTSRQQAAYEMLKASMAAHEAKVAKARQIFDHSPKGGWTDADRVPAK